MLIKIDKHTELDLELWKEYEEADSVHSELSSFKEKEEKSLELLERTKPKVISVSWGKDSSVLAHLAHRADLCCVYLYLCPFPYDTENPYSYLVSDKFLELYKLKHYVVKYYCKTSAKDRKDNANEDKILNEWKKMAAEANKLFGGRFATGIRMQESSGRAINGKLYGEETKDSVRPLLKWSQNDIFAYLKKHDVPVHPYYACLDSGRFKREQIRVGTLYGVLANTFTIRQEFERIYGG